MFGCYRRGDANDPDTYVAAVALVLSRYDEDIVKTITDPFSGLPGRKNENGWSGLPDVADVKEACEAEANRRQRINELAAVTVRRYPRLPKPRVPGAMANVFVGSNTPQYAAMVERSQRKDTDFMDWRADDQRGGIWVRLDWLPNQRVTGELKNQTPG